MNYALIGCGRIATNHIKAALENKLEPVAVCDIIPERMQQLLEQHGLTENSAIRRYTNYKTMLEEVQPELVAIATQSGSHAEIALCCMEHKSNVIVEKPMAMSIAEADRMIEYAKKYAVQLAVCHQNRFNLAVQELRAALEAGRFGKLSHGAVHIRWNRGESYYTQAPWRGTWAQDGGALMNQCIHGIDLLRWMMGSEITEVYGATRQRFHHTLQAEDVGVAVVKFKNGAVATIEGTTNVYPKNLEETLYIFGENGTVKLGGACANAVEVWSFADEAAEDAAKRELQEQAVNVYGNGHSGLYADTIDAIKQGRAPYVDAQAGKAALELVLAIYQSQKEGCAVQLPLKAFSTIEMSGEFDE